jgi:2-C-methyl-D-erythritol 2,4-cyclodiphosphate synthase
MKDILATALGISNQQISIKATTTERMGFTGRGEGIAAFAVTLLTTSPEV